MKRYLLFAGPDYYAYGGWLDFRGDYKTVAAAKAAHTRLKPPSESEVEDIEWAHIVDTETGAIVQVWDEFVDLWGTETEVHDAVNAKLAQQRRSGSFPFGVASVGMVPTSAIVMGQTH